MNNFKVTFNNGIELMANSVKEKFSYLNNNVPNFNLEIKIEDIVHGTEYYVNLLTEGDAFSVINVTDLSDNVTTFYNYKNINFVDKVLIEDGAIIFLSLTQSEINK